MTVYTCAFAFHKNNVLLIRKAKPDWQAGLLNGIGGKVEDGESIFQATVREFKEETGLWDSQFTPLIYHAMIWPEYQSHKDYPLVYFSAFTIEKEEMVRAITNTTGALEPCVAWNVDKVTPAGCPCLPNLPFLVEMAECLVICSAEERKLRQPLVFSPEVYLHHARFDKGLQ